MSQLPFDCLNDIIEYLEDDKFTLHSCILVNRIWCEVSVRIFWRDIYNYSTSNFNTLIACLPDESKKFLYNDRIIISIPTSKFPTFNYASFCKVLSITQVYFKIEQLLKNQQTISSQNLKNHSNIVVQEIFKMFMDQVSSLKSFVFFSYPPNVTFSLYSGAKDCLKNLSELCCSSGISTELFYQLSQICYNIQSLTLEFEEVISNGIADLISVQRNLKYFDMTLMDYLSVNNLEILIPSLISKIPNTLIKLNLDGGNNYFSLSFITNFSDLQELNLLFYYDECFVEFEKLQHVIFPQLQVLIIKEEYPRVELLMKFLETNGKNLKEICIGESAICSNNSLNLTIAKFCPNLKKLSVGIKKNELEMLKIIFNSCKNLENIKIWCGKNYLSEKEALEMVAKYSQNVYELILYHQSNARFGLLPEELESFFINWTNINPQRSLSLVIVRFNANSLDKNKENIEIINKYIKLGVVKKFKVTDFKDEEYN
ncbi:hypothetical protein RclHR1_13150006 [Rhizophagus clarus]|uniref:F-box domain-containing protein n=1 Tax=Rhizophagus clarus TaxID=94130 RepID=A0A2Z6Q995_9GLOM|nr:hypothetical protein RclHR1_13150006 [Rhizophagus clarus]GET00399.1 hypothetical protein GLOIN_2v1531010 [Rhizophagus clarus]